MSQLRQSAHRYTQVHHHHRAKGPAIYLAQPNGLGSWSNLPRRANGPAVCRRTSIRNVSLINLNFVFFANASVFFLESHLCMMLCLVANIRVNHIDKRMTDRKGSIAGLPLEIRRTTFLAFGASYNLLYKTNGRAVGPKNDGKSFTQPVGLG